MGDSTIKIRELIEMAFSQSEGKLVREKMIPLLDESSYVTLDFEGVELFATMFFNSCIGYFIKRFGPHFCKEHIKLDNISELGLETYGHSFKTQVAHANGSDGCEASGIIDEITEEL